MADSIRHGRALDGNYGIPDVLPNHTKLLLRRINHAIAYSKNRLVSWTEWLPSPEGSKRRNLAIANDMQGVPVRVCEEEQPVQTGVLRFSMSTERLFYGIMRCMFAVRCIHASKTCLVSNWCFKVNSLTKEK